MLIEGKLGRGLPLLPLRALRLEERDRTQALIRRLCHTVQLAVPQAEDVTLARVLGRYKLLLDNRDLGLSPHLMLDGFWEMWVTEALRGIVRHGMVAVDIGANVGYHTVLLADLVGQGGQVHAFEPNPRMAGLLRHSMELNGFAGRVAVHAAPVASSSGRMVRLVVPQGQPMNAHLASEEWASDERAADTGAAVHELQTVSLDDILAGQAVDVIKIDAEGAELDIWRGMQAILARARHLSIVLEFAADRYPDPGGFLREAAGLGFSLSCIDHMRGVQAATVESLLDAPPRQDQMLLLAR